MQDYSFVLAAVNLGDNTTFGNCIFSSPAWLALEKQIRKLNAHSKYSARYHDTSAHEKTTP